MTDTEQRAKWLKMADDIGIVADDDEVVALCEASVATERSRLAAAGEMTDDDIGHIGASYRADRATETTHLHFTRQGFREAARALITESAARATAAERERWHDGNRPLPFDRETLGRMVREAWVRWALTQDNPKPSWLVPYDELREPDKEADRQIGEAIARWTLIGDSAAAIRAGEGE